MNTKKQRLSEVTTNIKYIMRLIANASKSYIIITLALSFTALIDTIAGTWFSKIVFDSMSMHKPYGMLLLTILVIFSLSMIAALLRTVYNHKYQPKEKLRITGFMRSFIYEKVSRLNIVSFENPDFYSEYTRALSEADNRAFAVVDSLSQLIYTSITLATIITIIVYLDPVLIIFALCGAFATMFIAKKVASLRYDYNQGMTSCDQKMSYVNRIFYESQYAKDMRMNNLYSYFLDFYRSVIGNGIAYIKQKSNRIAFWEFISGILNLVLQILMTIYLTWQVYHGRIGIGDYAALLNGTFTFMFQLQGMVRIVPAFYEHSLCINNLRKILDAPCTIEKDEGLTLSSQNPLTIEFDHVSFSYPFSGKLVLNDVSMCFNAGTKTAIVGHNGAGKSTIIKLLLRFYDVDSGEIRINGTNIKEYNVSELRKSIGTVLQDSPVYAMPIVDFLLSRKCTDAADEKRVQDILAHTGLLNRIVGQKTFADVMNTQITKEFDENGYNFSGGEQQKLLIARALLKNAHTYIFDEASASLDPLSELDINEKLLRLGTDKTVILISHRLSTTKDVDIIYNIEHGRVIEAGCHDDLIRKNGKYAEMYNAQSESYKA